MEEIQNLKCQARMHRYFTFQQSVTQNTSHCLSFSLTNECGFLNISNQLHAYSLHIQIRKTIRYETVIHVFNIVCEFLNFVRLSFFILFIYFSFALFSFEKNNMDLKQLFKKRIHKIEMLNDFIAVYGCKQEAIQDIQQLQKDTQKIKELLVEVTKLLDEFTLRNREKHKELIEQMHKQQMVFLELLQNEMDKEPIQKITKPIKEANETNANESVLKEISNLTMTPNHFRPNEPARMSLMDYLKSPFTSKRIKPVALHFFDFERTISADEFAAVPS